MPTTGFDPRAHGFHFANDFVDKVVTIPGYGEVATDGRSGGMAFAALDYWFAGLPVPSHRPEDFPDRAVPEDGTRLADFIHKRLFDSYATWSARQFLTWTLAEDHPTWSSPGVARLTAEELPRVRRSIDAGRPVVLGLVGARDLDQVGRNRQVVAYGYDDDGVGTGGGPPIRQSGCRLDACGSRLDARQPQSRRAVPKGGGLPPQRRCQFPHQRTILEGRRRSLPRRASAVRA